MNINTESSNALRASTFFLTTDNPDFPDAETRARTTPMRSKHQLNQ